LIEPTPNPICKRGVFGRDTKIMKRRFVGYSVCFVKINGYVISIVFPPKDFRVFERERRTRLTFRSHVVLSKNRQNFGLGHAKLNPREVLFVHRIRAETKHRYDRNENQKSYSCNYEYDFSRSHFSFSRKRACDDYITNNPSKIFSLGSIRETEGRNNGHDDLTLYPLSICINTSAG
jgi:hypothetical protein